MFLIVFGYFNQNLRKKKKYYAEIFLINKNKNFLTLNMHYKIKKF